MIATTDKFPGVHVVIRSAGLARYVPFEMSIAALQVPVETMMSRVITSNLAGSINEVARATKLPFLWIIDDDHEFDPQFVLRLLAHNRPVLNGVTCMNKPPFHTVIYKNDLEVGEERFPAEHGTRVDEIVALLTAPSMAALDKLAREIERDPALTDESRIAMASPDSVFGRAFTRVIHDATSQDDIRKIAEARTKIEDLIRRGMKRRNKKFHTYAWKELDTREGVIEVFACGLSGMLINTDVFKKLDDPWFELGKTNPEEVGEDLYFCQKLRELSPPVPIAVDLGSPFGHLAPAAVWPTRMNDGAWTVRVQWENGQNIVVNRGDKPPLDSGGGVAPRVNADDVEREAAGNRIVRRTQELTRDGMPESEAFATAMREMTVASLSPGIEP